MTLAQNKKLLLALDGSEQSLDTARYVAGIAPSHLVEILVFHVMDRIPDNYWEFEKDPQFSERIKTIAAWDAKQKEILEAHLNAAATILTDSGLAREAVKVRIADKVQGVARDVAAMAAQGYAVVVGRAGAKKLRDYMLGSTAYKIVGRLSDNDVCLVSGSPSTDKLLWGVTAAHEAARAEGLVLNLLHGGLKKVILFRATRQEAIAAEAEAALEETARRLMNAGIAEDRIEIATRAGVGRRAGSILDTAREEGCGSVLICRRCEAGPADFFIGSTANRVIHQAIDLAVWIAG